MSLPVFEHKSLLKPSAHHADSVLLSSSSKIIVLGLSGTAFIRRTQLRWSQSVYCTNSARWRSFFCLNATCSDDAALQLHVSSMSQICKLKRDKGGFHHRLWCACRRQQIYCARFSCCDSQCVCNPQGVFANASSLPAHSGRRWSSCYQFKPRSTI